MDTNYSYTIENTPKGLVVRIYYLDSEIVCQPFNPQTGLPFIDEEEAKKWIYDFLSFIMPPEEYEKFIAEEKGENATSSSADGNTDTTTTSDATVINSNADNNTTTNDATATSGDAGNDATANDTTVTNSDTATNDTATTNNVTESNSTNNTAN